MSLARCHRGKETKAKIEDQKADIFPSLKYFIILCLCLYLSVCLLVYLSRSLADKIISDNLFVICLLASMLAFPSANVSCGLVVHWQYLRWLTLCFFIYMDLKTTELLS